jgi:hypothetical protein
MYPGEVISYSGVKSGRIEATTVLRKISHYQGKNYVHVQYSC